MQFLNGTTCIWHSVHRRALRVYLQAGSPCVGAGGMGELTGGLTKRGSLSSMSSRATCSGCMVSYGTGWPKSLATRMSWGVEGHSQRRALPGGPVTALVGILGGEVVALRLEDGPSLGPAPRIGARPLTLYTACFSRSRR